jgi:surfeit locus 1 family protein
MWNAKSLIGWVAVVAAFAVLVGLGSWQLTRRAEKHDLIARIEARLAAPPVVLPANINDRSALAYRRVTVTGRFLHDKEIHLTGRVRGGAAGIHVLTPLLREGGAVVFVNRGWVSQSRIDPATRAEAQLAGRVTVTGIARLPARAGPFTPANVPAKGTWFIPDIPAMARAAGLGAALPVIVAADATPNPGGFPKGGDPRIKLRDDHLQYAVTWYALALVLVVIILIARRRKS